MTQLSTRSKIQVEDATLTEEKNGSVIIVRGNNHFSTHIAQTLLQNHSSVPVATVAQVALAGMKTYPQHPHKLSYKIVTPSKSFSEAVDRLQ